MIVHMILKAASPLVAICCFRSDRVRWIARHHKVPDAVELISDCEVAKIAAGVASEISDQAAA